MFSDGFSIQAILGFEQQPRSIGLNQLTPSQIQAQICQIKTQTKPNPQPAAAATSQPELPEPEGGPDEANVLAAEAHEALRRGPATAFGEMGRGDPFARLNFPHLQHHGSSVGGGEFGVYKPFHSSVDAKLQDICESLAESQSQQKQGGKKKPLAKRSSSAKQEVHEPKVEISPSPPSPVVTTESDGSAGSSPLSDLTFPDIVESPWDCNNGGMESNYLLEKYPSEID
ncbi:hypothetical protein L484_027889 [Morus notabilis]|uniref:Uncharacterized protein n=1 Tax=Morus notabilis TaxID=981085 RepID=W9SHW1_9ROSA|nr:hypothetical protein L484_027889 [Morus notabilis]